MLVYGDHRELADPAERLEHMSERLRSVAAMLGGISRHSALVGLLIEAGQLWQGVADAGGRSEELSQFVHGLARCVLTSSDSGFAHVGDLPQVPQTSLAAAVELRLPEGFAFYAVYPEAYAAAARRLKLNGRPRVIGIRSIGTSLGAVVANAIDAPPAITVRPFGDPFARSVELPAEIAEPGAHYVIVDEGPGMSGSSFGAVADWLEERGVEADHIAFLPSHGGDLGPQASDAHRQRWSRAQRMPAEFDPAILEQVYGPLTAFTGGGSQQRLKFIGSCDGEPVILKFAGLGAIGERKLALARSLHAAGQTPEPLDFVHGFLVERWCGEGKALGADEKPIDELAHYIRARKLLFPAPEENGASIGELMTMCRRNVELAFGEAAASSLGGFNAGDLARRVRWVRTDNKLDREEWLRLPGGRLLKTDAVDHHQAHDLVGCQSVEWDVAGAMQEFALSPSEAERLIDAVGDVDPRLLAFHRIAYAAFRLGQAVLTGDQGRADSYRATLNHLLLPEKA